NASGVDEENNPKTLSRPSPIQNLSASVAQTNAALRTARLSLRRASETRSAHVEMLVRSGCGLSPPQVTSATNDACPSCCAVQTTAGEMIGTFPGRTAGIQHEPT